MPRLKQKAKFQRLTFHISAADMHYVEFVAEMTESTTAGALRSIIESKRVADDYYNKGLAEMAAKAQTPVVGL